MSIKALIENNIRTLENERNQAVAAVKDRVYREQIIPFNRDVDAARDKAISELNTQCASEIADVQAKYAVLKQEIVEASEKRKSENADAVIASETYAVSVKYDAVIDSQNKILSTLKE